MWPFVAALRLLFLVRLVLDRRNDDFIDVRLVVLLRQSSSASYSRLTGRSLIGPFGSAVGVLARRLALVLGRRVGTEVAAADAPPLLPPALRSAGRGLKPPGRRAGARR